MGNSHYAQTTIIFSLGYFCYDLSLILIKRTLFDIAAVVHHVIAIGSCLFVLVCSIYIIYFLIFTKIDNIFHRHMESVSGL